MDRPGSGLVVPLIAAAFAGLAGCSQAGVASADRVAAPDTAFTAMQSRGERAMGVDQYTSTHVFDALPDGGRIQLQRDVDDMAGVARIRRHLQHIARAFDSGDFSTPMFVHVQGVPGTSVMAAKRDVITYTYRELPRGGEVRIVTQDPQAVQAIHEFMAFQRQQHRAGGTHHGNHRMMNHRPHDHGDMDHGDHGAMNHPPHDHGGMDHGEHGEMEHRRHHHGGVDDE